MSSDSVSPDGAGFSGIVVVEVLQAAAALPAVAAVEPAPAKVITLSLSESSHELLESTVPRSHVEPAARFAIFSKPHRLKLLANPFGFVGDIGSSIEMLIQRLALALNISKQH